MCRLAPAAMLDIVRSCLLHHAITGVLPRWTYAGQETTCMPGVHSMTLMWQAREPELPARHGSLTHNRFACACEPALTRD